MLSDVCPNTVIEYNHKAQVTRQATRHKSTAIGELVRPLLGKTAHRRIYREAVGGLPGRWSSDATVEGRGKTRHSPFTGGLADSLPVFTASSGASGKLGQAMGTVCG